MRILLAVDGSACSRHAMERVRFFFPEANLAVVAVVPPPMPEPVAPGWVGGVPIVTDMRLEEELAEKSLAVAKQILGESDTIVYHIAQGDPGATIVRHAEEHAFDSIVVGSHGRNAFERLLMGSVATYVVNHATCPVMVIKSKP
ncbi:MAG: universal stress protein [Candidatus Sericytochromatia bacterium]|nr:universal stress protein [Candidatus Sericytochromatia bacterium]